MIILNMNTPFVDLTNQVVWNVRRGHGSFLTMELGTPHLYVREPISTNTTNSYKLLKRRRISVVGDWHFWIMHSHWTLETHGQIVNSDDQDVTKIVSALTCLDGQRLTSMSYREDVHHLVFDLGGNLKIERIAGAKLDEDRWQMFEADGNVLTCEYDGKLSYERRSSN